MCPEAHSQWMAGPAGTQSQEASLPTPPQSSVHLPGVGSTGLDGLQALQTQPWPGNQKWPERVKPLCVSDFVLSLSLQRQV